MNLLAVRQQVNTYLREGPGRYRINVRMHEGDVDPCYFVLVFLGEAVMEALGRNNPYPLPRPRPATGQRRSGSLDTGQQLSVVGDECAVHGRAPPPRAGDTSDQHGRVVGRAGELQGPLEGFVEG
jgi:hypothetical protein